MVSKTLKTVSLLLSASQQKLTEWFQGIDKAIARRQELAEYDTKKAQLVPKLKTAHDQGVRYRELESITGIPYQTIARWLKKEKEPHAPNPSKP
jgi:DNA invertase Pin-like site-specific DNA recombinase